ncbi:YfiT family bacillithiol transferase [Flammeovirga pacifica]|uniref:Metal-dependent hydrolase n=1 Tax=Flammeovirga pacifica TaxID=915059 RepID=A0A1S1Z3F6_FLAPC|nr:putative metal-dependent hydrolase [Flammeovirga pacifica]OHX67767.1 metal-dependent hydrolase [Flammeovirga pacifica]
MTINIKSQFPIGKCPTEFNITAHNIGKWISIISSFPEDIKRLIKNKSIDEINYKYRENGWKVKQVIHHCADSHMNSFIRFKLALTEENPTIRPYFEDRWGTLIDAHDNDLTSSIALLEGLHKKWVLLLNSLNDKELIRTFIHPENQQKITLAENIGIYAWHCEHHLAHIRIGLASGGQF